MATVAKRRGRYVLDFYDNQGKRHWITMPKETTKKVAEKKLRQIQDQLDRGVYISKRAIPLFSEVAQDWLDNKKQMVRETTLEMYKGHVRNHLKDFANLRVNRLTTASIEKFINSRMAKGMNINTLRKSITTINQIMQYAVRHQYIDYNPIRDAERPRRTGKIEKPPITILTPPKIKALLGAISERKYHVLVKLAIFSGARQGELLGLKWSDIDWESRQIHIQRTYNHRQWFTPKTANSDRRVDIAPHMIKELKRWRISCPPNELNLVFPNAVGTPINQNHLRVRQFIPAVKASGLNGLRFHDLRHTYASLLIEQGENIKYVQNQLGHSSPTVTLDVYAHLMKPSNQEAARRLEAQILGTGSNLVANT